MKIISIYSNKGGVGKTSSSVNLAYSFAEAGYKVLLCDLDPQGSSSFYLNASPSTHLVEETFFTDVKKFTKSIKKTEFKNLRVLPANKDFKDFDVFLSRMKNSRSRLRKMLESVGEKYDYVLLDCPPTISMLSENIFKASHHIVVPVIPSTLTERTLQQLYAFFKENGYDKKKIIPFFSMVQINKKIHKETLVKLKEKNRKFLETRVPFSAEVEKMGIHQAPVACFAKGSSVAYAYLSLFRELVKVLQK